MKTRRQDRSCLMKDSQFEGRVGQVLYVGNTRLNRRHDCESLRRKEEETKIKMKRYGRRFWAVYDGDTFVCVTVYKRGAIEVIRRLGTAEHGEEAS